MTRINTLSEKMSSIGGHSDAARLRARYTGLVTDANDETWECRTLRNWCSHTTWHLTSAGGLMQFGRGYTRRVCVCVRESACYITLVTWLTAQLYAVFKALNNANNLQFNAADI